MCISKNEALLWAEGGGVMCGEVSASFYFYQTFSMNVKIMIDKPFVRLCGSHDGH